MDRQQNRPTEFEIIEQGVEGEEFIMHQIPKIPFGMNAAERVTFSHQRQVDEFRVDGFAVEQVSEIFRNRAFSLLQRHEKLQRLIRRARRESNFVGVSASRSRIWEMFNSVISVEMDFVIFVENPILHQRGKELLRIPSLTWIFPWPRKRTRVTAYFNDERGKGNDRQNRQDQETQKWPTVFDQK